MRKYRFKTEEEFKRDGLWNNDHPNMWTSSGTMNSYLGKDIPDKYNRFCDVNKDFSYEGWSFSNDDYVLKETQPEYTVGKWYGCKNWNSPVDFVKLERVYDGQAYFTECLNAGNYQKEKQNWWSIVGSGLFEADMSIVSPLLPDGHPDKIVSEETAFVFPSKWCIKVDRNCQPEEVYKWRKISWVDAGYINYKGEWTGYIPHNYVKITLEQFKQHVLKESPVVESPKGMDMKAVQEEIKKRFPIGCKFIPVGSYNTYTLLEDSCTYEISGKHIYAHDCHGSLYGNGKWATLVSLPESKEESIPEYVECISKDFSAIHLGKIYKLEARSFISNYYLKDVNMGGYSSNNFKPSTKEAYEAQNAPKQLTKEDLVEGEIYIYDGTQIATYPEGPSLSINGRIYTSNPKWTWCLPITHATEEQKVLLRCEIEKRDKKTITEEWSEGTYAVGLKGNFGVYKESDNLVPVGKVFTIKENRKDTLVVKDHGFWIYKKNLKWFATFLEALDFSNQLKASPVPKESDYPVMPEDAYPSIKKETFIDNVQSVDVILRTKRKSIKF